MSKLFILSVYDAERNKYHGSERKARLIRGKTLGLDQKVILPGDIYMIFINESYEKDVAKDLKIFNKKLKDISEEEWVKIIS